MPVEQIPTKLFRQEVLDAREARYLGSIRVGRNPSFTAVAAIAVLCGITLVAYATWGEITRKARITGILVPTLGLINVTTSQAGTVISSSVVEGDVVVAGAPLMVVRTDRATTRGDASTLISQSIEQRRLTLQAERHLAQAQAAQRQQALRDRIRSMEAEQRQTEADLETLRRRAQLAAKSLERYEKLAVDGFVAEVQAQQKQEELLDVRSRLSSAERALTALARDANSVRAELDNGSNALQAQLLQIDRSIAALGQEITENDTRDRLVITAPTAGTISALNSHDGSAVQPGQTLATLLPKTSSKAGQRPEELRAELYAPSRTAGFVQPGQKVLVRYAAYPYQKFGMARGQILSVGQTPINAQDLPAGQAQALSSAAQTNEPLYRIVAALDSQDVMTYGVKHPLKPGMSLEADVIQDKRAVWEWAFDPILSIAASR